MTLRYRLNVSWRLAHKPGTKKDLIGTFDVSLGLKFFRSSTGKRVRLIAPCPSWVLLRPNGCPIAAM